MVQLFVAVCLLRAPAVVSSDKSGVPTRRGD